MLIIESADAIKSLCRSWKKDGDVIGFVPTMGALHEGHLSLVSRSNAQASRTIVSIYVNPTQFGPQEDLDKYPRTLEADLTQLKAAGTSAVYLPKTPEMYPSGYETYVINEGSSNILCGKSRPGHFRGVLTVVLKLLLQVEPDFAVFGLKDYQQFVLIQKMVREFFLNTKVLGAPLIREQDGLAMSSRNINLTKKERSLAPQIYDTLKLVDESLKNNPTYDESTLAQIFTDAICRTPEFRLDYFAVREQESLKEYQNNPQTHPIALTAVHIGHVRLIDNLILGNPSC